MFNKFAGDPLSERSIRDSLANLVTQSLLIQYNQNRGAKRDGTGGQYYEYDIGEELPTVLDALRGLEINYTSENAVEELCEEAISRKLLTSSERDAIIES